MSKISPERFQNLRALRPMMIGVSCWIWVPPLALDARPLLSVLRTEVRHRARSEKCHRIKPVARFWSLLREAIQEQPSEGSDAITMGLFVFIGMVKGKRSIPMPECRKNPRSRRRDRANDCLQDFTEKMPASIRAVGSYKFEVALGVKQPRW